MKHVIHVVFCFERVAVVVVWLIPKAIVCLLSFPPLKSPLALGLSLASSVAAPQAPCLPPSGLPSPLSSSNSLLVSQHHG